MALKNVKTCFRAYQLGNPGSSYSYYYHDHFTLVEARFNEVNKSMIQNELKHCSKSIIDCLHITSWDVDHCRPNELEEILNLLKPSKIETPGYNPSSDSANESLKLIETYKARQGATRKIEVVRVDPPYIKSLKSAEEYGYKNVCYWPKEICDQKHNNNSSVTLFRSGCFNVLSTGDVEDHMIGRKFMGSIVEKELDVLILPHHGSENGFVNQRFLKETSPTIAICNSNYDNQFDHPSPVIREWLHKHDVPIYTTKTGDVLVRSLDPHSSLYEVINLKSDSTEVSSSVRFHSKKRNLLSVNMDTLRDRIKPSGYKFPRG